MSNTLTIHPRQRTTKRITGLPPFLLARARSRLAAISALMSLLTLFAMCLWFFGLTDTNALPILGAILATGATLFAITRSRSIPDERVVDAGLVAQVVFCAMISIPICYLSYEESGEFRDLTWTCITIIMFPLLAPSEPRRMLVASIASAATAPIGVVVATTSFGDTPRFGDVFGMTLSPAFCVVFAYVGARMLYELGTEAARGRRMGSYELVESLGAGGMGEVWRADHQMLSRPAAVKLIKSEALGRDAHAMLSRFEQEAQATANLRSPHTVEVYDFGRSQDGAFYYVMELLDGVDLRELVETHGPLVAGRVIHLLRQACHSLGEAHAAGLIHRDIKPANIFVCRYGPDVDFVKVLDFGLVKERSGQPGSDVTEDNRIVGTPAFMAPEAVAGAELDGRADLYALGCVGYWLLTGQLVFEEASALAVAAKHLEAEPDPPSTRTELDVPPDLEAVIMRCLAKNPNDRPENAEALSELLSGCDVDAWTGKDARRWWDRVAPAKR